MQIIAIFLNFIAPSFNCQQVQVPCTDISPDRELFSTSYTAAIVVVKFDIIVTECAHYDKDLNLQSRPA